MSKISLQHVYKEYQKNIQVIKDFSLEIFEDEFLVFVGPSGSGKTTALRMIAGLEELTNGKLIIDGELQNDKDPSTRNLSFVFQNYALLPNMTTYQNIEFGLLNKKMTKLEKRKQVEHIANKLSLYDKLGSYPKQLSGGQRQRVALARALVDNEKLILFDEPLSNLDAVLRTKMRSEIVRFQKEFGVTCIYVTHDQIEAMAMASRIVLLIEGKIIQVGTPEQMYNNPAHLEVSTFIGSPETNVLCAKLKGKEIIVNDTPIHVSDAVAKCMLNNQSDTFYLSIRPQEIKIALSPFEKGVSAELSIVENFGYNKLLHMAVFGQTIRVLVDKEFEEQAVYYLDFTGDILVFDKDKKRIFKDSQKTIIFEGTSHNESTLQVIRELRNYGYEIQFDKQIDDPFVYKENDIYYLKIDKKRIKLKNINDLLNHFSYIK